MPVPCRCVFSDTPGVNPLCKGKSFELCTLRCSIMSFPFFFTLPLSLSFFKPFCGTSNDIIILADVIRIGLYRCRHNFFSGLLLMVNLPLSECFDKYPARDRQKLTAQGVVYTLQRNNFSETLWSALWTRKMTIFRILQLFKGVPAGKDVADST